MFNLSYILADNSTFIVGGFPTQAAAQAWADAHMPAGATAHIVEIAIAPVTVS